MGAPNILREMNRRRYLDTSINKFQFFVDSELTYLLNAIINSFASKTDDFDTFCNS